MSAKPNIRLLTKLLEVVRAVKPGHFDMGCFIDAKDTHKPECGTTGCMIGHGVLAGLFKGVRAKLKVDGPSYDEIGEPDGDEFTYVEWFLNRESIGDDLTSALDSIQEQLRISNEDFERLFYNTSLTKREATTALKNYIRDNS